ncbi:MAG: SlyX family protein [Bdellovibrio sp.]
MTEQRFIDLETKIAHQEYLIEELNQTVYQQQKIIDKLESTLETLIKRYQELVEGGNEIRPHEKPPHY